MIYQPDMFIGASPIFHSTTCENALNFKKDNNYKLGKAGETCSGCEFFYNKRNIKMHPDVCKCQIMGDSESKESDVNRKYVCNKREDRYGRYESEVY